VGLEIVQALRFVGTMTGDTVVGMIMSRFRLVVNSLHTGGYLPVSYAGEQNERNDSPQKEEEGRPCHDTVHDVFWKEGCLIERVVCPPRYEMKDIQNLERLKAGKGFKSWTLIIPLRNCAACLQGQDITFIHIPFSCQ
jgi:hypothetical protein